MKGLKKILGLTLAAMMTMSLVGCSSGGNKGGDSEAADKLQQVKDAGKLIVGTSADYAPYEFKKTVDGEEKIVGFDDFMVQEIASDLGVEVQYEDMDFDSLIAALQSGKVDIVLSGMTPNEERKQAVDFSELYYTDSNVCIVAKGKEDLVKSADDLKDLKVGVQRGTTQADYVVNNLGIDSAVQLTKIPDLMLELQNGKIDVIVTGKSVAMINVQKYENVAMGKTTVGEEVAETSAAAFKKSDDNKSFIESVNSTIKRLQDGNKVDEYMLKATKLAEEE
ncbi:transporter substrate-binding domain-containing protein [Terrisporobacter vanillatitrophus]|uniref:transporter substrate-binding domain-containing protein n=1 Tax=Terrisporobacter vanillatitrophus TaxID=3058402 RepID=UPI00336727F9